MGRRLCRSEHVVGELVDGDLVLLNLESGEYFGMNATGARIWELLGRCVDLDEVHESLVAHFRIEPEALRQDLEALLGELEAAGLIHEA